MNVASVIQGVYNAMISDSDSESDPSRFVTVEQWERSMHPGPSVLYLTKTHRVRLLGHNTTVYSIEEGLRQISWFSPEYEESSASYEWWLHGVVKHPPELCTAHKLLRYEDIVGVRVVIMIQRKCF
jgi:hypothetical protein